MQTAVTFSAVRLATRDGDEEAQFVTANSRLMAILVRAEEHWFLLIGFGACEAEGLLFATLDEAAEWVRSRLGGDGSSACADRK